MNAERKNNLINWLKRDEGFAAFPYSCPAGQLTIGYGRNLEKRGITQKEALFLLENDMDDFYRQLLNLDWFITLPPGVQDALINMTFNLGFIGLLKFKKMIAALENKDYATAAREALDSLWARQVPARAKRVAVQIRAGQ